MVVALVILTLLVLGLGGYVVYDKVLNKKKNIEITEEKASSKTELSFDSNEVKLLDEKYTLFSFEDENNEENNRYIGSCYSLYNIGNVNEINQNEWISRRGFVNFDEDKGYATVENYEKGFKDFFGPDIK